MSGKKREPEYFTFNMDLRKITHLKLKIKWKHCTYSKEERESYKNICKTKFLKYPFFMWLKESNRNMLIWVCFIISFIAFAIKKNINNYNNYHNNFLKLFDSIGIDIVQNSEVCELFSVGFYASLLLDVSIIGFLILQFAFVVSHIIGHALFLEKKNVLDIKSRFHETLPIIDHANYHHQHNKYDNWFPELSYYDIHKETNEKGLRSIIASHWHGYTMFRGIRLIFVFALWEIHCIFLLVIAMYELWVLVLPYAHGWQHLNKNNSNPRKCVQRTSNSIYKYIFGKLEDLGIIASPDDHTDHHIHTWPTVYKSLSSSGFYLKSIDVVFDEFWDFIFFKALLLNEGIIFDKVNISFVDRIYSSNELKEILIKPKDKSIGSVNGVVSENIEDFLQQYPNLSCQKQNIMPYDNITMNNVCSFIYNKLMKTNSK